MSVWNQPGTPPELEDLIGLEVRGFFVREGGTELLVILDQFAVRVGPPKRFQDRKRGRDRLAMPIQIGHVLPGFDLAVFDQTSQPLQARLLVGARFSGLDGDVLAFGCYGVRFLDNGFAWVKSGLCLPN